MEYFTLSRSTVVEAEATDTVVGTFERSNAVVVSLVDDAGGRFYCRAFTVGSPT